VAGWSSSARAVGGAEAVNLLPYAGPHTGSALRQARRAFACDAAIYVGDDDTDEDAFTADVDALLRALIAMRLTRT